MSKSKKVHNSRYIVGIDLGTTHTVVAYADTKKKQHQAQLLPIPQLVAPGEIDERDLLPSVRYHPAQDELIAADTQLPWPKPDIGDNVPQSVVGELARRLGSRSRGRYITSAKSWLCHASVDRTAGILPWGAPDEVAKISPVTASADFLGHVRSAWNMRFRSFPLETQSIVITVPASFDEAARALTLEAANRAGLNNVRLLEEPQAVFYDWLLRHKDTFGALLENIRLVLVCDLGGGTADFTLIQIEPDEGSPKLTRIGVGNHLMLGGDNIDLALARRVETQLMSADKRLSTADLLQLLEQCRSAKEKLLSEDAPEIARITLLGSGSKLIAGTRTTEIKRDEVKTIVLDGFFPLSAFDELPDRKHSGVVEFGLPYVADPAISKQIAAFLNFHARASRKALANKDADPIPDAVILNGGVFRSSVITDRVIKLLSSWGRKPIRQLENPRPDLSVAYGAVAYALSRLTGEVQTIGGGSARSYFLVVESAEKDRQQGVCLLPKGTDENQEIRLEQRKFSLKLGRPVQFHLVSTAEDTEFKAGDIADISDERFNPLPPLTAALETREVIGQQDIPVQLAVLLSAIGTMQVQCLSVDDPDQRWDVEFQIRKQAASRTIPTQSLPAGFQDGAEAIRLVFGRKSREVTPKVIKGLRSKLEKSLGPRADWDTQLLRALFDVLLEGIRHRRRSANHERSWLSLAGFCLRPGFGDPLDEWRTAQIWAIYQHNLQFVSEAQNWSEWWTLWRRTAGGLTSERQSKIYDDIAKFINPSSARQGKIATLVKNRGYNDIVRLAGVLERLTAEQKINLGEWMLKRLQKAGESHQTWWAVGRVGARVPFHGSIHTVVPKTVASRWLNSIIEFDWKKAPTIAFAAAMISRMSGDRERDIDQDLRKQIINRLILTKAPLSWITLVNQITELDEADEKRVFGEALPPGLKLLD